MRKKSETKTIKESKPEQLDKLLVKKALTGFHDPLIDKLRKEIDTLNYGINR